MEFLPWLSILLIVLLAIPLSVIDFRSHRLPNRFTYPAIAFSVFTVALAGIATLDFNRLAVAAITGAATWGIGYLLARFDGIGMGDVKLLTAMNLSVAWFSPFAVIVILAIGFTLASLVSLGLMVIRRANLKTAVAMGPYLFIGFGLVVLHLGSSAITAVDGS